MDNRFTNRTYFFDNGLRFACQQCGACCTGAPGTIYVGAEEIGPLAAFLGLAVVAFIDAYLYPFRDSFSIRENDDGRCLFFKDGCAIYPARPLQCRAFPFWFRNLRSEARWHAIQRQCPGIGQGRRHGKDEIIALAHRTMLI